MAEDTVGESYKVKVAGPGIQAERDVDLAMAMAVMQVMFGAGVTATGNVDAPARVASGSTAIRTERNQPLSIREFLESVGGRNIPAKITAIGRYMRDHEGEQEFSREEVKLRFRSAGEVMPGNFPRDFQKALQAGWIAEDPQSRGRFYVTRRGDEAIEQKFEGSTGVPVRTRRRRRSGASEAQVDGSAES